MSTAEARPVFASSSDQDGDDFVLSIQTDEADHRFVVKDTAAGRALLAAVSGLRPWIDERDRTEATREEAK